MNRSNVTLIIAKPSYEEMVKIFKDKSKENSEFEYAYNLITKDVDKKVEDKNFVSLFWSYIKWNTTFSDVSKVIEYLEDLAVAIEMKEELTEDVVKQYGWELLTISDYGHAEFDCYDRDEGAEGDVFAMPCLNSVSETYNELEEEHENEDITIYTVTAFHLYMDNQFEVFNEVLLTTTSELKAKIHMRKEYKDFKNSFMEEEDTDNEEDIFSELNLGEENAFIQLFNDDRIELSIVKTTLQK